MRTNQNEKKEIRLGVRPMRGRPSRTELNCNDDAVEVAVFIRPRRGFSLLLSQQRGADEEEEEEEDDDDDEEEEEWNEPTVQLRWINLMM